MISTDTIYRLFQQAVPELKQQALPENTQDFEVFHDWLNENLNFIQYVDLKEYYDNGIEDAELLKRANINTSALAETVDQAFEQYIFSPNEDRDEGEYSEDEDLEKMAFELLFDTIHEGLDGIDLKLFVVIGENPYWFVLPDQAELNQQIIDSFNQTFADQDLTLTLWE